MNAPWKLICLIVALVSFAFAAFTAWGPSNAPYAPWHGRLIAIGLFFFTLSYVIS